MISHSFSDMVFSLCGYGWLLDGVQELACAITIKDVIFCDTDGENALMLFTLPMVVNRGRVDAGGDR